MYKTYVSTQQIYIGGYFYNPTVPGCHVFPKVSEFYSEGWLAKGARIKCNGKTVKFGGVIFSTADNKGFLSAIEKGWFKRVPLLTSMLTKQKPESLGGHFSTRHKTQKRLENVMAWNNTGRSEPPPEPIESYKHAMPQSAPVFDGNSLFYDDQTTLPEIPEELWDLSSSGDLPALSEIKGSYNV